MADYPISPMPSDESRGVTTNINPNGSIYHGKRMLGDEGAAATGAGAWFRINPRFMTFMLYNADAKGSVNAGVTVKIEAAMELAAPVADTQVHELASLTASAPVFNYGFPFRYVRARVSAHAGAKAVQVGLHAQS